MRTLWPFSLVFAIALAGLLLASSIAAGETTPANTGGVVTDQKKPDDSGSKDKDKDSDKKSDDPSKKTEDPTNKPGTKPSDTSKGKHDGYNYPLPFELAFGKNGTMNKNPEAPPRTNTSWSLSDALLRPKEPTKPLKPAATIHPIEPVYQNYGVIIVDESGAQFGSSYDYHADREHHNQETTLPTQITFLKPVPLQGAFTRYYENYENGRYYYTDPATSASVALGYPCYAFIKPEKGTAYASPYSGYGRVPPYITAELVSAVRLPVRLEDKNGVRTRRKALCEEVLSSIRDAWIERNATGISAHLTRDRKLAVYLGGDYAYSISKGEYNALTSDAMTEAGTDRFEYVSTDWGRPNQVCAVAEHVFTDKLGEQHTAYQSYVLEFQSGTWRIMAVGTGSEAVALFQ